LYFNINLRITIGSRVRFERCQSIHIEKSVQELTSTAKIELPREFRNAVNESGQSVELQGKSILDYIKRKDSIKIAFGYDGDYFTEFQGYIDKIGADIPLILECQDEMFQLKQSPKVTKSIKSEKLIDILNAVVPEKYTIVCDGDYKIGKWVIQNATAYEVLEELKEKAGIRAWFSNPETLNVGMLVDFKPQSTHKLNFSQNIRRGSDIKFERKESKPLFLTVESKQKTGEVIQVTAGEKGGNEKNVKLWPNMTKSELQTWAQKQLESSSFDGFEGTVDTWCYPRIQPGDSVDLARPFYPDRHQDGKYFVEAVTIDVNGADGIKRANKLSYKLD
jgi:hypothetical protein